MTESIKNLKQLAEDVELLEDKYKAALNYICALRTELAHLYKGISDGNIDIIKDMYLPDDVDSYMKNAANEEEIFGMLDSYNFGNNWARL